MKKYYFSLILLLGNGISTFAQEYYGDMNHNGGIDIEDITTLINYYLNDHHEEIVPIGGKHQYVDLGLPSGTLWATSNVGAESMSEIGSKYAWGEIDTKEIYEFSTYKWCNNGNYSSINKYCTDSRFGAIDGRTILEKKDDVASVIWGKDWRMPSKSEFEELLNSTYCTWTWTTVNNTEGYMIVSTTNGNSIFLPAAGACDFGDNNYKVGEWGYYWTSVTLGSHFADLMLFHQGMYEMNETSRCLGASIRPVLAINKNIINNRELVITGEVAKLTRYSAELSFCVNFTSGDEDSFTSVGIQYGLNETEFETSSIRVNESDGEVKHSIDIYGLKPSTTYYYRAFTEKEGNYTYGNVKTFTTQDQDNACIYYANYTVNNITGHSAQVVVHTYCDEIFYHVEQGVYYCKEQDLFRGRWEKAEGDAYDNGTILTKLYGLEDNTHYFYRPYVIKDDKAVYGEIKEFFTKNSNLIFTGTYSDIEHMVKESKIDIKEGTYQECSVGICWSPYEENPTIDSNVRRVEKLDCDTFSIYMRANAGTTYYRAYAIIDGSIRYGETKTVEKPHVQEFVDLGLPSGTLWATCNIGASCPEDYGESYSWGETYSKYSYYSDTYAQPTAEYNENNEPLLPIDNDAAHVLWGGKWRIPTNAEMEEICNEEYCTWEWTTINGTNGFKVTSNVNNNYIFLPITEDRHENEYLQGNSGCYWTSSLPFSFQDPIMLYFDSGYKNITMSPGYIGRGIRPVMTKGSDE